MTVLLWSRPHWRQSRQDGQHSGDKVDRVGDNVDRYKLSNSSCYRFVAKTGNKVDHIRRQSTLLPICRRFRQQSTFNKVDRVEFNFVASVYRLKKSTKFQNLAFCKHLRYALLLKSNKQVCDTVQGGPKGEDTLIAYVLKTPKPICNKKYLFINYFFMYIYTYFWSLRKKHTNQSEFVKCVSNQTNA